MFTPHLLPMIRGILSTLYAPLTREVDLQTLFEERYADEPFVDVMPAGSTPDTRSVRASNMLPDRRHRRDRTATSSACIAVRTTSSRAPPARRSRT